MAKVEVIDLKIPNLGEAESTEIIEINIKNGAKVELNDPLIVLESEKAAMEIPSDFSGTVLEIFVKEGEEVSEGQIYARIETIKEDVSTKNISSEEKTLTNHLKNPNPIHKTDIEFNFSGVNAGPAVRKYARELDINLNMITGTGRNKRITKDDLKLFIHSNTIKETSYPSEADFQAFGSYKIEKLSKIRSLGAKNMAASWKSIPHVTHFEEAEITKINSIRASEKASPLAYFIKVISKALENHKIFNSSLLENDEILLKDFINIGIAVDTPDGLVVPVIKDAPKKNIREISDEISLLAEKAKTKKLLTKDLQGATFTVSSLGKIGGTGFTPIINPPEVAIIAISRSKKSVKLIESTPHEVELVPFSLSYDHRVINGADAGKFMDNIRYMIENYS